MSSDPRLIKKYPNRRLYDTEISRYITLDEIRQLVIDGVNFRVIDKKTKKDITRSILLQVISEQEEDGEPILSIKVLSQIIRFYGDGMQKSVTDYLEHSMQHFVDQQQQFREQLRNLVGNNPINKIKELSKQNEPLWRSIRREFLHSVGDKDGNKDESAQRSAEKDH